MIDGISGFDEPSRFARSVPTSPDQVVAGSHKKYWWKCSEGEDQEWDSVIESRTRSGSGCPCCSGRKVSVTNSLTSVHPEVAVQWHPTKNGSITPDQVPAGSHTKYWWLCPEGPDHEWQVTVGVRTVSGSGCPCCAGQKVSVTNSLASLHPDVAVEWHPTKNNSLSPD